MSSTTKSATLSKSTNDLSEKLTNNFRASTLNPKMHGPEFEALYNRIMEKLRQSTVRSCDKINKSKTPVEDSPKKYNLSAQNLQKFNVLSTEALKQETEVLAAKLDSASLC